MPLIVFKWYKKLVKQRTINWAPSILDITLSYRQEHKKTSKKSQSQYGEERNKNKKIHEFE